MLDILVKKGLIVDGSGLPPYLGDIAISDGRIVDIAEHINTTAVNTIEANGLVVAPGFIDIHRHADCRVFDPQFGEGELRQGLTTIVNGNCGLSIAPRNPQTAADMQAYLNSITGSVDDSIKFETFSEYLDQLSKQELRLNVGMLVGSGSLRIAANGFNESDPDTAAEQKRQKYLMDALDAGALGISLGLAYNPDKYHTPEHYSHIFDVIKDLPDSFPITAHIRSESNDLLPSIREAIQIAQRLNKPMHISHFKCLGRKNWGHMLNDAIALIENAR